ncbi:MAG TPA: heme NO-binding domain-containing protein [Paucimonas sp.]|nr:heme NO-binding domain-containing protein [Paucimonas sp.]
MVAWETREEVVKGIVFAEFIGMVEARFSAEVADRIISSSKLATGGAYTSVGTYNHLELLELVERLSDETGIDSRELVKAFGEYLLLRFVQRYPSYFETHHSAFDFLATIDSKIHVEVRKLYPDAELPSFTQVFPSPDRMVLTYRSSRPFGDLAEGLIRGCITHYGTPIRLAREDLAGGQGAHVRFTLIMQDDD